MLRALGQNPSNEELIEMIREADLDGKILGVLLSYSKMKQHYTSFKTRSILNKRTNMLETDLYNGSTY